MRPRTTSLQLASGVLTALAVALVLGFQFVGWWMDGGPDDPAPSDLILVLCGSFARPMHAADLYAKGYARQVWLGRCRSSPGDAEVRELGVRLPAEEEVFQEILLRKGVKAKDIRLYGQDVNSTAQEALALGRQLQARGKRILMVTSRFHCRRARLTFRRLLPDAEILCSPTPYEPHDRRWWRRKDLAVNAVLEGVKTLFFLAGGRYQ